MVQMQNKHLYATTYYLSMNCVSFVETNINNKLKLKQACTKKPPSKKAVFQFNLKWFMQPQ